MPVCSPGIKCGSRNFFHESTRYGKGGGVHITRIGGTKYWKGNLEAKARGEQRRKQVRAAQRGAFKGPFLGGKPSAKDPFWSTEWGKKMAPCKQAPGVKRRIIGTWELVSASGYERLFTGNFHEEVGLT